MATPITIKENGLAAYFEVSDAGKLLLLGILDENAPAPEIADKEKNNYDAVEVATTGLSARYLHKALNFGCTGTLVYKNHEGLTDVLGKHYIFHLTSPQLAVDLHYIFVTGTKTIRSWSVATNISDTDIGLEYLSSFAITGLADSRAERVDEDWRLMTPHNGWCREFDWSDLSLGELGYHYKLAQATNKISASNTGTWSTKEYLPGGCLYNTKKQTALLWQIESNSSWSWEISDITALLYLRLAGPSEMYNDWWKNLKPGDSFESVHAALSFGCDFNDALAHMTAYRRRIAFRVASDRHHPVIFNDYMGCLNADPTTEKLIPQIDAAAEAGCEIFCIDAGWYADKSGWWGTIGSYVESPERFPGGFAEVFDYIRSKGMRPGLWVEPEDIGIVNHDVDTLDDDCFFMRHGKRVIFRQRYQLDMRHPKVRARLTDIVDRLVRDYGIAYFKFDYNIDPGVGTECHSDSYGDGLFEHSRAIITWIDEIMEKHPDLIIENCSSGGMRMDYLQLQHYSVQSLTDNWANKNIVQIAAAAPTGVLPEQACVWCLPRPEFSAAEIASTLVNAMFRRIHLSGGTAKLDEKQKAVLHDGIRVYKETRHLVDKLTPFYPLGIPSASSSATIHCVGFRDNGTCFLTLTNLGDLKEIAVPLDFMPKSVDILYPSLPFSYRIGHNSVIVKLKKNEAVVLKVN